MAGRNDSDASKGRLLFSEFDLSNKGRPPPASLDAVGISNPDDGVLVKHMPTLDEALTSMDLYFESDDDEIFPPKRKIKKDEKNSPPDNHDAVVDAALTAADLEEDAEPPALAVERIDPEPDANAEEPFVPTASGESDGYTDDGFDYMPSLADDSATAAAESPETEEPAALRTMQVTADDLDQDEDVVAAGPEANGGDEETFEYYDDETGEWVTLPVAGGAPAAGEKPAPPPDDAPEDRGETEIASFLEDVFGGEGDDENEDARGPGESAPELDELDFARALADDEEAAAAAPFKTTDSLTNLLFPDADESDEDLDAGEDEAPDDPDITGYLRVLDAAGEQGENAGPLAADNDLWDIFDPGIPTDELRGLRSDAEPADLAPADFDPEDDLLSLVPAEADGESKDASGRSEGADSTLIMDKPQYEEFIQSLNASRTPGKSTTSERLSASWVDTDELFAGVDLEKEWEKRLNAGAEGGDAQTDDVEKLFAGLKTAAGWKKSGETETDDEYFRNTLHADDANTADLENVSLPPLAGSGDDILSTLAEEDKETAELLRMREDAARADRESAADAESDAGDELAASLAGLDWEEDGREPAAALTNAAAFSDGTESELDLEALAAAAGWETVGADNAPEGGDAGGGDEEEEGGYRGYGGERTVADDDDFHAKVRKGEALGLVDAKMPAAAEDGGEGELAALDEIGEEETLPDAPADAADAEAEDSGEPAEAPAEEVAVNPMDVFANMDDFDDFADDGLDDDMKALLDDDEASDNPEDAEASASAEPATEKPLPPGIRGKIISLWRLFKEKAGRYLPLDKAQLILQALGFRENWRFYLNLLSALIASASAAVIVSYFLWYKN